MKCPRCQSNLAPGRADTLTAHGCPRCAGVWLGKTALAVLVNGLNDDALAAFRKYSAQSRKQVDESVDNLACPRCQGVMTRQRVDFAWLDVDVCAEHGTWFDRGEIERISEAVNRPETADWRSQPPLAAGAKPAAGADPDAAYRRVQETLDRMKRIQRLALDRMESGMDRNGDW